MRWMSSNPVGYSDRRRTQALLNQATSSAASVERVSREARWVRPQSGRYQVIDASPLNPDPARS